MDSYLLAGKKITVAGVGILRLPFTLALRQRWPRAWATSLCSKCGTANGANS